MAAAGCLCDSSGGGPLHSSAAAAAAASQQGGGPLGAPLQGLTNTARGLVLFASRLLRPLLGTPIVEAALLPCGLARSERD